MLTLAAQLKRREKNFTKNSEYSCTIKYRHDNILSAMNHCQDLHNLQKAGTDPLMMYHCDICEFVHVGHLGPTESYLMYGGYSENIRELQKV